MNNDTAIRFDGISKQFFLGEISGNMRENIGFFLKKAIRAEIVDHRQSIWALKDVSFEIKKGDCVGIIGPNGSGKTTALKLISRISSPTSGNVFVKGKISALIELGAGLHPELTGRENVYMAGAIQGLKRKEIDNKFDEIVDFSGLEEFIDTPIKRYSSGMYLRLGFSVVAALEPDILLVDEILAVGDSKFKEKCILKIHDFIKKGVTFVVVSHDKETIQRICPKSIFLYKGKKIFEGETSKAFDEYLSGKYPGFTSHVLQSSDSDKSKAVEITNVELLNKQQSPNCYFKPGDEAYVLIEYKVNEDDLMPIIYSRIFSEGLFINYCDTSFTANRRAYKKGMTGKMMLHYKSLNLLEGDYIVYVGAARVVGAVIDEFQKGIPFHVGSTMREGRYKIYFPYEWQTVQ